MIDQPPDVTAWQKERQRCEVWTRVMGYHRPVSHFNTGKQSEHADRRYFTESPTGRPGWVRGGCGASAAA